MRHLVLRPFIDRFNHDLGALPKVENYEVVWADMVSLSDKDKADIALKKSQALGTYVNSQGSDLGNSCSEQFVRGCSWTWSIERMILMIC